MEQFNSIIYSIIYLNMSSSTSSSIDVNLVHLSSQQNQFNQEQDTFERSSDDEQEVSHFETVHGCFVCVPKHRSFIKYIYVFHYIIYHSYAFRVTRKIFNFLTTCQLPRWYSTSHHTKKINLYVISGTWNALEIVFLLTSTNRSFCSGTFTWSKTLV